MSFSVWLWLLRCCRKAMILPWSSLPLQTVSYCPWKACYLQRTGPDAEVNDVYSVLSSLCICCHLNLNQCAQHQIKSTNFCQQKLQNTSEVFRNNTDIWYTSHQREPRWILLLSIIPSWNKLWKKNLFPLERRDWKDRMLGSMFPCFLTVLWASVIPEIYLAPSYVCGGEEQ